MIRRVLVANRGEIAQRIISCCIEMGIECIAAYSEADRNEMYVPFATHSTCIGPAFAKESYRSVESIIAAAQKTGCDAVHPGYGFLSESPELARACEEAGIKFVGPSAKTLELMGDRQAARELMRRNGVPVAPGSLDIVKTSEEAARIAEQIGYPVLVKATAGHEGRGMRRANGPEDIADAFEQASHEGESYFDNGDVFVERLIPNCKHIEVQIFADSRGNCVHMGERDCSIQRDHRNMVAESPCNKLTPEVREAMEQAAVTAARACGYVNAGTVEFVVDDNLNFYFIGMKMSITEEHPVTEAAYAVDLVREQLRVASGLQLSFVQEDLQQHGHSIECRINAECPQKDFRPSSGKITMVHLPSGNGARVDSAIYTGYTVGTYYDFLIAKITVWAPTRLEAVRKMRRCLEETVIEGIETNLDYELFVMFHGAFLKGGYDTGFIDQYQDEILELESKAIELEDTEGQKAR